MLQDLLIYHQAIGNILMIWTLAVMMPGPDTFLIIRQTINKGKQNALSSASGIVAGTIIWLVIGSFFINLLSKTSLFSILQYAGGIYLIKMSFGIFLSLKKTHHNKDYEHLFTDQNSSQKKEINNKKQYIQSFLSGIIINLSNPKPPIFISIILSRLPADAPIDIDFFLLVVMCLIPSFWFFFVVQVLSIKSVFKIFSRHTKKIDLVGGIIFLYFGINLLMPILKYSMDFFSKLL